MASSSGTSSGSSLMPNSGSEEDLRALIDQKKRKRMISNKESARRSRMKKQKHLDDLTAQVAQLTEENHQIITSMKVTTQLFVKIETENSVLRARAGELTHRLQSLNEILSVLNAGNAALEAWDTSAAFMEPVDSSFNHFNMAFLNQPILASPDLLRY